jgi:polyisoprenoid-binding protein YceI
MRKIVLILIMVFPILAVLGQDVWTLDPGHSRIRFTVTHHMISEVDGFFREFEASMTTSKDDFSDAVFEFSAKTASINTENEPRDKHLKSPDIFDVEKHPDLNFKSTSFAQVAGEHYKVTGDMTIKGNTLPIILDVWLVGPVENERAKRHELGFKATGSLMRQSFGVGENLSVLSVSDEVGLRITGEFNKSY